jgi:F420H(2)-dependent quinone reductase
VARNRFVKAPKRLLRVMSFTHRNLLRVSGGALGGTFHGEPMILLTTTGRKTGKARTHPLCALPHSEGWLVAASNAGNDVNPGWYVNLRAKPDAIVEVGKRTVAVRARDATAAERADYWPRFVAFYGAYAEYESATDRTIPVVVLDPVGDAGATTG